MLRTEREDTELYNFKGRLADAAIVTLMQGLVVGVLGIPVALFLAKILGLGVVEVFVVSGAIGLFLANLMDIQEFGKTAP